MRPQRDAEIRSPLHQGYAEKHEPDQRPTGDADAKHRPRYLRAVAGAHGHRLQDVGERERIDHVGHVGSARRDLVGGQALQPQLTHRETGADHGARQRQRQGRQANVG